MSVSFVLTGHTPQYLKKIRSDLHETFSVCEDWFPKLIINVCWHARARLHTCNWGQQTNPYISAIWNFKYCWNRLKAHTVGLNAHQTLPEGLE